jgi:hypothetical protein
MDLVPENRGRYSRREGRGGGSGNPLASQTTLLHPSTAYLLRRTKPMATVAAFWTSSFLAIRHKLLMDHYLHPIFACYKVARWPFIFSLKRTQSKRGSAVWTRGKIGLVVTPKTLFFELDPNTICVTPIKINQSLFFGFLLTSKEFWGRAKFFYLR